MYESPMPDLRYNEHCLNSANLHVLAVSANTESPTPAIMNSWQAFLRFLGHVTTI